MNAILSSTSVRIGLFIATILFGSTVARAATTQIESESALDAYNTTVQGRVVDGKLVDLQVAPESRRKDVIIMDVQSVND